MGAGWGGSPGSEAPPAAFLWVPKLCKKQKGGLLVWEAQNPALSLCAALEMSHGISGEDPSSSVHEAVGVLIPIPQVSAEERRVRDLGQSLGLTLPLLPCYFVELLRASLNVWGLRDWGREDLVSRLPPGQARFILGSTDPEQAILSPTPPQHCPGRSPPPFPGCRLGASVAGLLPLTFRPRR